MEDVLIVGAGPTGLTLAAVLARAGCRPRLIDRAVVPPADRSRAIVIQARTLELFEDLGVVRDILEAALVVPQANIWTHDGRRGTVRIRPEWIESAYGQLVTLPQDETERILCGHVEALGVRVERGVELSEIEEAGTRAIALLRHADGTTERAEAAWIVGCDGAHSGVRRAIGMSFPGLTYPDECLLGDVDLEWGLPDAEVSICPTPEGMLLAFPLPGVHRFRIIMISPSKGTSEDRHLGAEEFIAHLTRMAPRVPGGPAVPTVLASRWLTRYRLHRRGVTSYRKGRCFVAGDAAHIHSPVGAQGMNTGIQDAYNLGWKLALVARGESPVGLLDSYGSERHRVGEVLLKGTDRAFAAIAGGGWAGRMVRRLAPTLATRLLVSPVIGRRLARFVSQTTVRYRRSPLSVDGPGAAALGPRAPRSGDRVPDLALDDGSRLHALLHGPKHTLLLFGGGTADSLRALGDDVTAAYGSFVQVNVLPRETAAHARFGASNGAIYLVRPDGYITFRGAATDGAALRRLLGERFPAKA